MKKVSFYISITLAICYAQDDGRYVPDHSGDYVPTGDDGKYIPDDSGKYIPDYSGLYHPDGSGKYVYDGSGQYQEKIENYKRRIYSSNLETAGSVVKSNFVKPNLIPSATTNRKLGTANFDNGRWKIIRQVNDIDIKGYHWEYETENEINAEESGKIHNEDSEQEALHANGYYRYTGPDNKVYSIMYTADEKGFIPKGEHLPVSLQKALAQISSRKN